MHFLPQEDFFIILHDILAEMDEVTELQPVSDAHVPVMKFKFQGISIDLLYAGISLLVVPEVSSKMIPSSYFYVLGPLISMSIFFNQLLQCFIDF